MVKESRKNRLMVVLSDREKEIIAQAANDKGMGMSAYCRMVLLDIAKKEAAQNDRT